MKTIKVNPWALPALLLAAAILASWVVTIDRPMLSVLAGLNLVIAAVGIVQSISHGLRPVSLIFFVFAFSWLGFGPIYQIATGAAAWGDRTIMTRDAELAQALLMNTTMSVCFLAGAAIAHGRGGRQKRSADVEVRPWFLALLAVVALGLAPYVIASNGGLGALFTSRNERGANLREAGLNFASAGGVQFALVSILPAALAASTAVLTVIYIRSWSLRGHRWVWQWHGRHVMIAVLSILLLMVFANPLTNTRFIGLGAFGAAMLTLFQPRSPKWGALIAMVGIFGTLLIYPLGNYFRQGVGVEAENIRTGLSAFAGPDFDGFQQTVNAVLFVQDRGHSYGHYIVSAIGFFIPRNIWEWKARPASIDVAEDAGYWFVNLSLPPHAELYIEFGWVGLIVGIGVLGFLAGRADWAWLHAPHSRAAALAPYFALAMLGILRGPFGSLAPIYLTTLALIALGLRRVRIPAGALVQLEPEYMRRV